jgi:hypothetical protein
LLPKTTVLYDGLVYYAAVAEAVSVHTSTVVEAHKPRNMSEFKWINAALGNLKT